MIGRILALSAFVFALGGFFGYVEPTWTGSIAKTQATIAADDRALAAAKQYETQKNDLASSRNAISSADINAIDEFLPSSVDNVGLILDLNALAARTGLSVSSIDVAQSQSGSDTSAANSSSGTLPSSSGNPVGSVDLSLSAVGTFQAFQGFLGGIEQSQRLLDVHNITIAGSKTGVYKYKMLIRFYWLR